MKETFFTLNKNFCPNIPQMRTLYRNIFSNGKQLRAALVFTTAKRLHIPPQQRKKLAQIIEYIHHSSILHDDVIDRSPIRRGGLSAWMQLSMKKSILAGDYLMAQAANDTADMKNLPLMKLTARTIQKLIQGEWLQNSLQYPKKEKDIQNIHELKTASLFQWCLKAPFLLLNRCEKKLQEYLTSIGFLMGILFQRSDDLLDFNIRNYENKQTFRDLKSGFFNSFAVHLLKNKSPELENLLKNCSQIEEVKNIIGKNEFTKILLDFDKQNEHCIQTCHNKINSLKEWLLPEEYPLINELEKWPKKLYWRKSV